mgnify:CR=1 FL=1
MFWLGRINAVLAILLFVGIVFFWWLQGPAGAGGWIIIMGVIRFALKVVDVLWTAATGSPLFYQVKILERKDGR